MPDESEYVPESYSAYPVEHNGAVWFPRYLATTNQGVHEETAYKVTRNTEESTIWMPIKDRSRADNHHP